MTEPLKPPPTFFYTFFVCAGRIAIPFDRDDWPAFVDAVRNVREELLREMVSLVMPFLRVAAFLTFPVSVPLLAWAVRGLVRKRFEARLAALKAVQPINHTEQA